MSENNEIVRVIRRITPVHEYWSEYGQHANLYGVTIVFDLDYTNQTVTAKWSICNGDNFNKKIGIHLAKNSKASVTFRMMDLEHPYTLTTLLEDTLLDLLGKNEMDYYGLSIFEDRLNLFLDATRKLKQ